MFSGFSRTSPSHNTTCNKTASVHHTYLIACTANHKRMIMHAWKPTSANSCHCGTHLVAMVDNLARRSSSQGKAGYDDACMQKTRCTNHDINRGPQPKSCLGNHACMTPTSTACWSRSSAGTHWKVCRNDARATCVCQTHTHTTIALGCRNSWHGTAPVATETVYISPNCSHLCTNASHIYACSHPASCLQCPAVAQRNEIRILTHVPGNTTTHILIPKSSIPWRRIGRLKKETVS